MRKILLLAIALILCYGCPDADKRQYNPQDTSQASATKELILKIYLDRFLLDNPDCLNNEILRNESSLLLGADFLLTQLGDSIQCISELPLEYSMMMRYKNDKYIVKFTYGELAGKNKISDKYRVSFQVFSIVDESTASKLIEGKSYNIYGSCLTYANKKSFMLPNGGYVDDPVRVSKWDDKPYFSLGSLMVTSLTFRQVF